MIERAYASTVRDITQPLPPDKQRRSLIRSAVVQGAAAFLTATLLVVMFATGDVNVPLAVGTGLMLFFALSYLAWALQLLRKRRRGHN